MEKCGEATSCRFGRALARFKNCEKGTQRRRGRGGLRGGFCDNTTACCCLVLLLLSQRQLPSASVFDHKKAETRRSQRSQRRDAEKNTSGMSFALAIALSFEAIGQSSSSSVLAQKLIEMRRQCIIINEE